MRLIDMITSEGKKTNFSIDCHIFCLGLLIQIVILDKRIQYTMKLGLS